MLLFLQGASLGKDRVASAASPLIPRSNSNGAETGMQTRREAIRAIPLDKLSEEARAKADSVLSSISVFRRLPVKVIDCDPDMYLFLVRHPDVVVNIWELLDISKLRMRQTDDGKFTLTEPDGASVSLEFIYQSHDIHIIYGEGFYRGPLLARQVNGRGLMVLRSGYVRETNGRYYIANRLDCFINVEPIGAELLTKTVSPLVGKTADNNFLQSAVFLGSISRTAEVNCDGIKALALKLENVHPQTRLQLAMLAEEVKEKSSSVASRDGAAQRR
ncbi:MAG: hypothetical protein GX594_00370 [Pirellulaceae bacterium]|nr:hypothetical protein [Pirellulaceae bacterium]